VLRGARAITMRADEVIEDADIVIDGTRIVAVGRRGEVAVPADARVIDLAGATIVPGFVDTHYHPQSLVSDVHTSQVWQYLATLAYGTTTTRDPQTGTPDVLTYADRVESGAMIGPRIYSTGPGVGRSEPVQSLEHARDLLRRYSEYYDTRTLKMYMAGNRRQRQWIVEAARDLQLMPTTEGGMDMSLDLTHVIDGYSGVEHNLPVVPLYNDVVTLLARSGTVNSPTLLVSYGGPLSMNRFYTRGDLHDDPKIRRFFPHDELDRRTRRRGMGGVGSYGPAGWFMDDEYIHEQHADFVKRVVAAGGTVGVGGHGEFQGLGYHWELWLLASGGMTAHEVLRAATLSGAGAIGLAADIGSIEAGKLADLVVLDRNPLDDIAHTTAIRYVMKNGRLYEGASLDEVWPRVISRPVLPGAFDEVRVRAGIR
jgi:imidazolonepropionase-like amidohydrolase